MQRSISYQKPLVVIFWLLAYIVYVALGSIYLFLPPFIALLFYYFRESLKDGDILSIVSIAIMFLFFEAERGFWFGSLLIYVVLLLKLVVPKIEIYVRCKECKVFLYSILVYLGYWLFVSFCSYLFMMESPMIDWHIVLFILIDFIIMAILV